MSVSVVAFRTLVVVCRHSIVISALTGHSPNIVPNFTAEFNQLVAVDIEEYSCLIGGDGIVVEIDESKLVARKIIEDTVLMEF